MDGVLHTPYQYTEEQLAAAVEEARRLGMTVGVHAMGEPGTLYAAQAGVASIDHATQLSDETMRLMREKHIPAVPTFAIFDYFAHTPNPPPRPRAKAFCSTTKSANLKSRSPPAFPLLLAPTWAPSRTARKLSKWS